MINFQHVLVEYLLFFIIIRYNAHKLLYVFIKFKRIMSTKWNILKLLSISSSGIASILRLVV